MSRLHAMGSKISKSDENGCARAIVDYPVKRYRIKEEDFEEVYKNQTRVICGLQINQFEADFDENFKHLTPQFGIITDVQKYDLPSSCKTQGNYHSSFFKFIEWINEKAFNFEKIFSTISINVFGIVQKSRTIGLPSADYLLLNLIG